MSKSDDKLYIQAAQQRYPLSQRYREAIVQRLFEIVVDRKNATSREVTAAAKVLLSADKLNLEFSAHEINAAAVADRNRILALAQEFGIETSFRVIEQDGATSGGSSDVESP